MAYGQSNGTDQEHALLSQVDQYADYVTEFFQQYGYLELAWLHHVSRRRFGHAAGSLDAFRELIPAQQERTVSLLLNR
jgi:hypothetical protein